MVMCLQTVLLGVLFIGLGIGGGVRVGLAGLVIGGGLGGVVVILGIMGQGC